MYSNISIINKITSHIFHVNNNYQDMILKITDNINEGIIGLNYLNNIPNFVKYYNVTSIGTAYHILMQKVDGISFNELVKTIPTNELYNITLQILMALANAYKKYGLIHGDLHLDNIIIEQLVEPRMIYYEEIDRVLSVNYMATIIDYGLSSTYDIKPSIIYTTNDIFRLYLGIALTRGDIFFVEKAKLMIEESSKEISLDMYYRCIEELIELIGRD